MGIDTVRSQHIQILYCPLQYIDRTLTWTFLVLYIEVVLASAFAIQVCFKVVIKIVL